jgi:hypothetical protein
VLIFTIADAACCCAAVATGWLVFLVGSAWTTPAVNADATRTDATKDLIMFIKTPCKKLNAIPAHLLLLKFQ